MSGKAGLKAGLIGAGVLALLTLLSLISDLIPPAGPAATVGALFGCACCGIQLLVYAGAGVLAGSFLSPPRDTGAGAGAGAIAGVLSGVGAGIMTIITSVIRMAFMGAQSAIDPMQARRLIEAGINPKMLAIFAGWGGAFLGGGLCCLGWIAIGAGLGALGGLIFAAAKSD